VLKASPGRALSEGPRIGPESKPEGRTILSIMNSPGEEPNHFTLVRMTVVDDSV
jgi:hypothetical protein